MLRCYPLKRNPTTQGCAVLQQYLRCLHLPSHGYWQQNTEPSRENRKHDYRIKIKAILPDKKETAALMSKEARQGCVQACPARLFGADACSSTEYGAFGLYRPWSTHQIPTPTPQKWAFTHRLVLEDLVANRIFRHGSAAPLSSPRTEHGPKRLSVPSWR